MLSQLEFNLSGSYVALITPMLDNGDIDFGGLKTLVEWHIEQGTDGLVILGTTAETATLSIKEQLDVLNAVIQQNAGRLPLIVGNGTNSTHDTIEKTKLFDELDIQGFLTVTPYYNKPNQKGMMAHFEAVAAATAKPIILYNVPGRTGVDLANDSVIQLAKISNIVAIKDATGDLSRVDTILNATEDFLLFSGDDATSCQFLASGGHGVITVTGNVEPMLMKQMVSETLSNAEQGKVIDEKLSLLHRDLFIEPNPVPAKWALVEKNIIQSDMVRLPLVTMEPFNKNIIKEALRHAQR